MPRAYVAGKSSVRHIAIFAAKLCSRQPCVNGNSVHFPYSPSHISPAISPSINVTNKRARRFTFEREYNYREAVADWNQPVQVIHSPGMLRGRFFTPVLLYLVSPRDANICSRDGSKIFQKAYPSVCIALVSLMFIRIFEKFFIIIYYLLIIIFEPEECVRRMKQV